MNRGHLVLIATIFLAGCTATAKPQQQQHSDIDDSKVVDLTYSFDEKTIYWPTAKPFTWEKEAWGPSEGGYWYTAARYGASEHGGTHLDAPIHFAEGKRSADAIPVGDLVGPAYVVDISGRCAGQADCLLSPADLAAWEARNGRVAADAILLVRTGWGRHWGDKKAYLGTDKPGDTANLRFPGISRKAAELIVQRKVDAVGIDTASLDYGASKDFIAHRVLNGADIYGLENVANMERLPAKGATLIALPMKIKGGSGGPTRIIAILP